MESAASSNLSKKTNIRLLVTLAVAIITFDTVISSSLSEMEFSSMHVDLFTHPGML